MPAAGCVRLKKLEGLPFRAQFGKENVLRVNARLNSVNPYLGVCIAAKSLSTSRSTLIR